MRRRCFPVVARNIETCKGVWAEKKYLLMYACSLTKYIYSRKFGDAIEAGGTRNVSKSPYATRIRYREGKAGRSDRFQGFLLPFLPQDDGGSLAFRG